MRKTILYNIYIILFYKWRAGALATKGKAAGATPSIKPKASRTQLYTIKMICKRHLDI